MGTKRKKEGNVHLLKDIAEKADVEMREAQALIRAMVRFLEKMPIDDKLRLTNLGIFKKVAVPGHAGRNPKSGEAIEVPYRERIRFYPSSGLRDTK